MSRESERSFVHDGERQGEPYDRLLLEQQLAEPDGIVDVFEWRLWLRERVAVVCDG